MKSFPPEELYYITVIDQLRSILERGVLSHEIVSSLEAQGVLEYTSIASEEVVGRRKDKLTPAGKSLWHYANLYFQPRNPMMYNVVRSGGNWNIALEDFVVVGISGKAMHEQGVFITDGNAASNSTQFHHLTDGLATLRHQWTIIQNEWWKRSDDSKRMIMAECLVPAQVNPVFFKSLYVVNPTAEQYVKQLVGDRLISVVREPYMFFN